MVSSEHLVLRRCHYLLQGITVKRRVTLIARKFKMLGAHTSHARALFSKLKVMSKLIDLDNGKAFICCVHHACFAQKATFCIQEKHESR
jgi:hypothetical protein